MKKNLRDNIARFFYDTGKLNFAVLVLGPGVRKPIPVGDFAWGIFFTLLFFLIGVILDSVRAKEE